MIESSYSKLFSSIVTSTIWREDDKTRIVWITMLAIKNRNGEVSASVPGLAALSGVALADCELALRILSAPDVYSRTKEFEGRRIEQIDGGWQVLNHDKFREAMSDHERHPKKSAYLDKLKDPRWQQKRLKIFELDKWTCRRCGNTTQTLHVHHLCYRQCEPWDYDNSELETLCETCHNLSHSEKDKE